MASPRSMVLGTAGHIDHGKTSLVRALTGVETDRHPEEKRRGITIELGFASWQVSKDIDASIVDVPGHDSLVRTMIAGAGGIDLVMMVISAEDGVMPQTREHLNVCGLLGVRAGIVALTKVDRLSDPDEIELAAEDVRDCLAGTVFEDAPIIPVSAHSGEGLDKLKSEVLTRLRNLPGRDRKGPVRFPVDRAFTMKGHGTVVTGTLLSGEIDIKREPELQHLAASRGSDEGETRRIRSLQVRGESVHRVRAGSRLAANLGGVEREQFSRGDVLVSPGGALRSTVFHGLVSLLEWTRMALHAGRGVQVCAGTGFANATVDLLASDPGDGGPLVQTSDGQLSPGHQGLVRFRLESALVVWAGQRFVLRAFEDPDAITHGLTIGGGEIVDPLPSPGRAQRPRWVRVANELRSDKESVRALAAITDAGEACIDRSTLAARAGVNLLEAALGPLLNKPVKVVELSANTWVDASVLPALRRQVLAFADAYHRKHPLQAGIPGAELEMRLPGRCSPILAKRVISDALEAGELRRADAKGRLARPGQGHLDPNDLPDELQQVLQLYQDGALMAPTIKDVQTRLGEEAKVILERVSSLQRAGLLVRVSADLSYALRAHEQLVAAVGAHLAQEGQIDVQALKTLTGLSRKFVVPLLEHFDRLQLTTRQGDIRIPGPKAPTRAGTET